MFDLGLEAQTFFWDGIRRQKGFGDHRFGSEEMEAVIIANVMRRAGIDVVIAGLNGAGPVTCARKVVLLPDMSLEDAVNSGKYDAVVLPGGAEGAKNLAAADSVKTVLKDQEESGRIVAAVCAAPTAFKSHGIALGKNITSHPSFKHQLTNEYCYSEVGDQTRPFCLRYFLTPL